jgi:hypothetical protein
MKYTEFDPSVDYTKGNLCSLPYPDAALRNDCTIRVCKKLAQCILMYEYTVIRKGAVRYLQLKDIGLGIYEVKLLPIDKKENMLVKDFY